MLYRYFYEEDGTLVDEMAIHERRYDKLIGKMRNRGLSGEELRELERNPVYLAGKDIREQASYGLMALRHAERNRGNPKD